MRNIKFNIARDLFLTKRPLRIMLLELAKMCQKLTTMSLLNIQHGETYALPEFVQSQVRIQNFKDKD